MASLGNGVYLATEPGQVDTVDIVAFALTASLVTSTATMMGLKNGIVGVQGDLAGVKGDIGEIKVKQDVCPVARLVCFRQFRREPERGRVSAAPQD